MTKFRNREALLSLGDVEARRLVLDVCDEVLRELDSYSRIRSIMSFDGRVLRIGTRSWDLDKKRGVYLVGAGKAANAMALAVEHVLGDRLTDGVVIVKVVEDDRYGHIRLRQGGHPLPNAAGAEATAELLALVDSASPQDLFIGVISGGSSALMNMPIPGVSLDDERAATDLLLKSGAGIYEINAVRRHISQTNGGRLAQRIAGRGAELIGLGISDGVGVRPTGDIGVPYEAYASTPIGPDRTTIDDARRTLTEYQLRDVMPRSIVDYLDSATIDDETPKSFPDNTYFLINSVGDASLYASRAAAAHDMSSVVLSASLIGEAREAGRFLACLAQEVHRSGRPVQGPTLFIATGEVTTTIRPDEPLEGAGGPGHELTAAFALDIEGLAGAAALSIDTEGTDGTSAAAGGVVDGTTVERCRAEGVSLVEALRNHSTHDALAAAGDAIFTGNTGTNVCDLTLVLAPGGR